MSSSQSNRSDVEIGDTTLPSPASSVKSMENSQISSRKSSPSVESGSDSNGKRRRSTRISHQPEVNYKPHQEVITLDDDEPKLVLKKKKLEETDSLVKKTPEPAKKVITISTKNGKLQFNEPELADPIISVTGLPLGSAPNAKIKKDSLWPKKKSERTPTARSSNESTPGENTLDSLITQQSSRSQERIDNLKTKLNEKIQKQSSLRSSKIINPVSKKGAERYAPITNTAAISSKPTVEKSEPEPPSTPKKKGLSSVGLAKSFNKEKRKIKNASPKKTRSSAFGFDNPTQLAGVKRETAYDFNDVTKDNDDFCSSCGEPGIFLCCETCPKSFHFACCDPPYSEDNLPDDEWYCNECEAKRNPPKPKNSGLFGKLLDQVEYRNPIQFQLPKKIRERFEGVVTGNFGEYEDVDYKDYKPAKIHAFQQTDPDLHFDKDGNILICSRCGTSGISTNKTNGDSDRLIASCEFCPCAWHLDCLDPPLSTVKQLGKKWKCPNHVDDFLRDKRRRLKKPNIVDVDQVYGFKNNGDIEVKLDEAEGSDSYDENDYHEIPRPAYLNNEDTEDGISAPLPKHQQKLWTDSFSIFRVPEKGIVLDFWSKVNFNREEERRRSLEILELSRQNNELLSNLSNDTSYDSDEKQTVQTLVELKDVDFKGLLEVAARELNVSTVVQNVDITKAELDELRHIKKLMKLKGQDRLLEFLQNE